MISKNGEFSKAENSANERSSLDTLAQLGTKSENSLDFELNKQTTADDKKQLKRRAKRKHLGHALSVSLVTAIEKESSSIAATSFAENNEIQRLKKQLWNMFHCTRSIKLKGDKLTTRYCKNKLCLVCNSIRQAQLLERYSPLVDSWGKDAYFVTLTIKNVAREKLEPAIAEMLKISTRIQGRIKKQLQREGKEPMAGIRKLECTHNPYRNDFHPHFHLIIKGYKNACKFREYWVEQVGKSKLINCELKGKNRSGESVFLQDIRPAGKGAAKELLKYFTKIISSKNKERNVHPLALISIYEALQGKRTLQPFGAAMQAKQAKKQQQAKQGESELVKAAYVWEQGVSDWVDHATGELLSEYTPTEKISKIVKKLSNDRES